MNTSISIYHRSKEIKERKHPVRCAWCGDIIRYSDTANSHGHCDDCIETNWKRQVRELIAEMESSNA